MTPYRHADREIIAAEWIVYDALYAYCQEMVQQGKYNGAFKAGKTSTTLPPVMAG